MTESQFQAQIIQLAKLYGWKIYHTHDSRKSEAGYPDLCMVKGTRLLFAEVKTDIGKMSPAQKEWFQALKAAKVECYLWRPMYWDCVQEVITR